MTDTLTVDVFHRLDWKWNCSCGLRLDWNVIFLMSIGVNVSFLLYTKRVGARATALKNMVWWLIMIRSCLKDWDDPSLFCRVIRAEDTMLGGERERISDKGYVYILTSCHRPVVIILWHSSSSYTLTAVVLSKALRALSFVGATTVLHTYEWPVTLFLFYVFGGAAIGLSLQKPWSGKRSVLTQQVCDRTYILMIRGWWCVF